MKQCNVFNSRLWSVLLGLILLPMVGMTGCANQPVKAKQQSDGTQTVKVLVRHGYQPSEIQAKAGKPLKIEFYRDEEAGEHSCVQDLEIPEENVKLSLPAKESQIVELKPHGPGDVPFQCGMKMIHGVIHFK